jgi:hypothetical protein
MRDNDSCELRCFESGLWGRPVEWSDEGDVFPKKKYCTPLYGVGRSESNIVLVLISEMEVA